MPAESGRWPSRSPWSARASSDRDVLCESVSRPLFFAVQGSEAEFVNRMPILLRLRLRNLGIVSVNPYGAMVMGDGKGEDLAMELFLKLHRPE